MSKRTRTLFLIVVLLVAVVALSGCSPRQGDVYNQPQDLWEQVVSLLAHGLDAIQSALASIGISGAWGWAIIIFTIVVKALTFPLTMKQLQASKAQQDLQPKIAELQQKYGKDRAKLQEEQMKLYKEMGVSPLGGCLPLLIQFPILIALYQVIYVLANPIVGKLEGANFLWIPNLALPSIAESSLQGIPFRGSSWLGASFAAHRYDLLFAYASLPVIMTVSQLVLQKMAQPVAAKKTPGGQPDQAQMMGQMMTFMPLIFGFFTLSFPAGLTLYWTVSNLLQIVQQYFITGWGGLASWFSVLKPKPKAALIETAGESAASTSAPVAPKIKRRRRRK